MFVVQLRLRLKFRVSFEVFKWGVIREKKRNILGILLFLKWDTVKKNWSTANASLLARSDSHSQIKEDEYL